MVEVDALESGVGAVLSQRQRQPAKLFPCAFFCKKLSPVERNYDIGNRELLAVKLAFEEWRHWLEGARHPFLVLTDHNNLEYIRTTKRLNPRQARWALYFTRFHFTMSYRPGFKNVKADALSRQFDGASEPHTTGPIVPQAFIVSPIRWDLDSKIQQALCQEPTPPDCPEGRTYVPAALRRQLILCLHSSPASGHPGIQRSVTLARERY